MIAVVPIERSTPEESGGGWIYELRASHPMPEIDLTRTIRSEFFSPNVNRVFQAMRKVHRPLLVAHLITTASFFVTMTAPSYVGRYVALIGVLVGLPGNFLTLAQLRYDLLKLLVHTFDVWFTTISWFIVFTILALIFSDLRAIVILSFWLGTWPNVWHDAVISTIRPLIILNIFCIVLSFVIVASVNANITDGLHSFVILRYRDTELPARAIISDGFMTVCAIMVRNVYRRRDILLRRTGTADLECVIYRSQLIFHRCQTSPPIKQEESHPAFTAQASPHFRMSPHVQTMRLVPLVGQLDVRNTMVPPALLWIMKANHFITALLPFIAYTGLAITLGCVLWISGSDATTHVQTQVLGVGFAFTLVHSIVSAMLYHRALVSVIYTSFDFVFFMIQVVAVHLCICDLFTWRVDTVLLASTSWLWIHWLLLLDALTPPVRCRLRIHRFLPRVVFVCALAAGVLLVYAIIFANPPARIVNRVIWKGSVMGHDATYTLLPQFYSALATVFFLSMRFCWRQWRLTENELVVIDGPVVFTNTFARSRTMSTMPSLPVASAKATSGKKLRASR